MEPHPYSKLLFTISSLVVIGAITTIGYFSFSARNTKSTNAISNPVAIASVTPTPTPAATPTPTDTPAATTSPTPTPTTTPTTVRAAAAVANDAISTLNLTDVQATLADVTSSLSAFNQ